jgi:cell division protease FtsH
MVCEYGMSERLGPMALGEKVDQPFLGRDLSSHPDYSEEVAAEIDQEIRRLVDEAHQEAWVICSTYREHLDSMVKQLIEKETLEKHEVEKILADVPKRAARGEIPRRLLQDQRAAAVKDKAEKAASVERPTKPLRRPGAEPAPA